MSHEAVLFTIRFEVNGVGDLLNADSLQKLKGWIFLQVEDSARSNADGAAATSTVERLKKRHADGYSICPDALF